MLVSNTAMLSISRTEQAITPVEVGITELAPSGLVQELSSSGIKLSSNPTGHCFLKIQSQNKFEPLISQKK